MKIITSRFLITTICFLAIGIVVWWFVRTDSSPKSTEEFTAPSPLPPAAIRIVAFGDSLTAGYNLSIDDAYPAILEHALVARGWSVEVINSGVSGETSAGGVRRAEFVRSLEPDIVLFGLGGNDALRLLPPEALESNLAQALEVLLAGERPPRVLLLGMRAPANADAVYRTAFDTVYPRVADRYGLPLVPFFLEGVALDSRYTLPDGIHPNVEGYSIIVEKNILPSVLEILAILSKEKST